MAEQRKEHSTPNKVKTIFVCTSSFIALAAALSTALGGGLQVYDRFTSKKNTVPAKTEKVEPKVDQYEKAKQLFYTKKIDAAIIAAQEAVQANPDNAEARKLLAACYGVQNNMEACASEYREAVRLNKEDDEALVGLGTALVAIGDNQGAKEVYSRVTNNPNATSSHREYARVQMAKL